MRVGRGAYRTALLALTVAGGVFTAPEAHSQDKTKIARIGWLSAGTARVDDTYFVALQSGLRELGYIEGQNVVFERRWAGGLAAQLPELAAELVRLKVDVICTTSTPASMAAKAATTTIPIVFAAVAFPDQSGLVASYAHPGGNITGVAFVGGEYGKRLELLKQAMPKLRRMVLIYNSDNRGSVLALEETQRWAKTLNVMIEPHSLRRPQDLNSTLDAIARSRPDALMTTADPVILSYHAPIVAFAAKQRLPSIFPDRQFVDAGGLMFYGGSIPDMYKRAAIYVDRILKGAKPLDLPVEHPLKFDLVINLGTARKLGLTIPRSVLQRADQLIE
jgi:putative tryptophan/tyrosine transport system substrate-binding protein